LKGHLLIAGLLLCVITAGQDLFAEPAAPENVVTTDSLDLTVHSQGPQKSAALAMAMSIVLPGTGHEYLGRDQSAIIYLSADIASIFGFFFCSHYAQKLTTDADGYAWIHSGAQAPSSNTAYWNAVGSFMTTQQYNTVMDLNRTPDQKITSQSQTWHWDDQTSQDRFNTLLSTSHHFQVAGDFLLGAMVINRALAFIDVRAFTHDLRIQPRVSLSPQSVDVSFAGSF
jgi:hypothetical protein